MFACAPPHRTVRTESIPARHPCINDRLLRLQDAASSRRTVSTSSFRESSSNGHLADLPYSITSLEVPFLGHPNTCPHSVSHLYLPLSGVYRYVTTLGGTELEARLFSRTARSRTLAGSRVVLRMSILVFYLGIYLSENAGPHAFSRSK